GLRPASHHPGRPWCDVRLLLGCRASRTIAAPILSNARLLRNATRLPPCQGRGPGIAPPQSQRARACELLCCRCDSIPSLGGGRPDAAGRARPSWSAALGAALEPGWIWHRRSFADALAAACPDIDVIRLGAPPHSPPPHDAAGAAPAGAGARLHAGYLWALLYCGVATALSALAFPLLHQTNIVMLFLLAVVAVALRHGRGPAALASVLSVGLFDFFFVQPLASFAVSDVQYLLTFLVLLGVGLLIGQLTAGLRLQARTSIRREAEARGLYEFARELSSALQPQQIVASADAFIQATFGARCALFILGLDERLAQAAAPGQEPGGLDPAVAQWVYDHGQPAGAGTATLATSALLYLPLKAPL